MAIAPGFEDYFADVDRLRSSYMDDVDRVSRQAGLATSAARRNPTGRSRYPQGSFGPSGTGGTAPTAAGGTGVINPLAVGSDIGQYYAAAMASDPRMAAIQQNLSGVIPEDVYRQIAQRAAERGISIGSYGGGADQAALLRALGLTSMDLRNKGISQYGEMYGQVPQLSPQGLFITPTAQAGMDLQRQLQTEQLQSTEELQAARLASDAELQAERLAAEANLQSSRLGASAAQQQAALTAAAQQAAAQQAAQAAARQSSWDQTNAILSSIISGSSMGGTTGADWAGGYNPTTGSVTPWSAPESVSNTYSLGDYWTDYDNYFYGGTPDELYY